MPYADAVARTRQAGSLVAALHVEGIPDLFTTHPTATFLTTGLPAGLTQRRGFLSTRGIQYGAEADPKRGELRQIGCTFRLVDAESAATPTGETTRNKVTDLMRGIEGVTRTSLRSTIPLGTGVAARFNVDSTAGFSSGADVWVDLECMTVDVVDANTFEPTTRARFGSVEVVHTYDADDLGLRPEGPLTPEVTNAPFSWYGRRVDLWIAEAPPSGQSTTSLATRVYRGRIVGEVKLASDLASWEIPTEPLSTVIDTVIPTNLPTTTLRGFNFQGDVDIDWEVGASSGTVRLGRNGGAGTAPPYDDVTDFMRCLELELNNAVDGLTSGGLDNQVIVRGYDGKCTVIVANDAASDVTLRWRHAGLMAIFGSTLGGGLYVADTAGYRSAQQTTAEALFWRAFASFPNAGEPFDILVASSAGFTGFNDRDDDHRAEVYGVVRMGRSTLQLHAVDAGGANTLRVQTMEDLDALAPLHGAVQALHHTQDEGDITISAGFAIRGDFVAGWQLLVESAQVPADFRGYLRTGDFDWTGIDDACGGFGIARDRFRIVTEPTSLRAMLYEDLAWSGAFPTINGALISAHSESLGNEADAKLALDTNVIVRVTGFVRSRERIVNQLVFRGNARVGSDLSPDRIIYNDRTSQQRYGIVAKRELTNRGLSSFSASAADDLYPRALGYFAAFGSDYPIVSLEATIAAADLVPGDTVTVTHPGILPDPSAGTRGVTAEPMIVLRNEIKPFEDGGRCELDLMWIVDGAKRSGYAPAARITGYAFAGGEHQLTAASGVYAIAQAEGLYFGTGDKVLLQEWDNETPIADEAFTIVSVSADGLTIAIDAAPTAAMQAAIVSDACRLVYDQYDTAGQTDRARQYVHVADDADNDIGATTDDGFRPS